MTPMIVGIPAFRELAWLPSTLASLAAQTEPHFEVWVCVNHPREWNGDPAKREAVADNRATLAWLDQRRNQFPFRLVVLDAVGADAPPLSLAGVGWARRFLFERALAALGTETLCVSLDADTVVEPDYLARVREAFDQRPNAVALAAPYRHPLPEERLAALQILRYEIYMRYYQVNLWRIGSPYAFLPLGSALAFRGQAWARAGGFPTRKAGEDFYFLQQLRKLGPVIRWIDSRVYPAARPSDRVPFGTGPLIGGSDLALLEARFPFFPPALFDRIGETFALLPRLFRQPQRLPIHEFLEARLGGEKPFDKMRRTFPDEARFVRACHDRLDGLRTLQCLRFYADREPASDPQTCVNDLLARLGRPPLSLSFALATAAPAELDRARDALAAIEAECQRAFMTAWDPRAAW